MGKSSADQVLHPAKASTKGAGKGVPQTKSSITEGPTTEVKSTPYAKGNFKK